MKSLVLSVVFVASVSASVVAADWGTVKGRFTYDGSVPTPQKIEVTKDVAFCGKHDLNVEELVVDPDSKGIANVVVYLYQKRGAKPPKIHPDYAATAKDEVVLDNENCRFAPHVLLMRTSQTLIIGNKDGVAHNASIVVLANQPQNNMIPVGAQAKATFKKPETLPATVKCDVHPWMNAKIVLKDHPYMAVTDKDGNFEIKNMPVGKHTLQYWHEKCGYVKEGKQGSKTVKLKRGRLDLTVKKGENDLGEYKLSSVFKGK